VPGRRRHIQSGSRHVLEDIQYDQRQKEVAALWRPEGKINHSILQIHPPPKKTFASKRKTGGEGKSEQSKRKRESVESLNTKHGKRNHEAAHCSSRRAQHHKGEGGSGGRPIFTIRKRRGLCWGLCAKLGMRDDCREAPVACRQAPKGGSHLGNQERFESARIQGPGGTT